MSACVVVEDAITPTFKGVRHTDQAAEKKVLMHQSTKVNVPDPAFFVQDVTAGVSEVNAHENEEPTFVHYTQPVVP